MSDIETLKRDLEEARRDRDMLLAALGPFVAQLACVNSGGEMDQAHTKTRQCGECHVCKAKALANPLIKWFRKGCDFARGRADLYALPSNRL